MRSATEGAARRERRRSGRWVVAGLVLLAVAACRESAETPAGPVASATRAASIAPVDHHVHILGPGLLADWTSLGVPFSRPDAAYLSADALFEPKDGRPGLAAALLVPMAHLYGNDEFRAALGLDETEERARVARENDWVAAEARRHPGRAIAYCSVGILRPYAWDEIDRCRRELGSPGVKIHLASGGVDLRDAEQLAILERLAAWAERERVALLVHFDPQRRGLETEDVERFLAEVLGPHPDLEITIAHLGGSGGYGPWTRSVFGTFQRWLSGEAAAGRPRPGVRFDVSGVLLEEESEGVPASTPEDARALAEDLRATGLERLVFGSDYPVFEPRRYAAVLESRLGLAPADTEALLTARLPVMPR
ncbi:MAG: amidohydrolase family protein [Thermoanaerobaculia bacterium]